MEILASVFIVLGASLAFVAAVGLQRFDDVLARMHAATKPATLGLMLVVGGTILVLPEPGSILKLVLVLLLQVVTAPVGAHLVGRAAIASGEAGPDTYFDPKSERLRPD
ncbi:MAG TPA: monovalent cation/H(+) antiporter subunit G [Acidimicrobiia bacterium]|nr:monovalent cation/H(+) antiporter subunit G [Acidimicrobiia bacterium]